MDSSSPPGPPPPRPQPQDAPHHHQHQHRPPPHHHAYPSSPQPQQHSQPPPSSAKVTTSTSTSSSVNHVNASKNSSINIPYDHNDHEQQIEALEQALHIQINKRMEAETRLRNTYERLKVEKNKRKQLQLKQTQTGGASSDTNNTAVLRAQFQSQLVELKDLQDLVSAFMSEVDGLDGDESESTMDRKDVLWMMNEVNIRMNDAVEKMKLVCTSTNSSPRPEQSQPKPQSSSSSSSLNDIDGDDDGEVVSNEENDLDDDDDIMKTIEHDKMDVDRETLIAKLEGTVAHLSETNQRLMGGGGGKSSKRSQSGAGSSDSNQNYILQEQYRTLKDKHSRLEARHGNILKEMQESLTQKNQEIGRLKQDLVSWKEAQAKAQEEAQARAQAQAMCMAQKPDNEDDEADDPTKENRKEPEQPQSHKPQMNVVTTSKSPLQPSSSQQAQVQAPSSPSMYLTSTMHKDIQIQNLTEEVEERNAIIDELKSELDQFTASMTSDFGNNSNNNKSKKQMLDEQMMEADKVKIKYLENIIHDLESKLRKSAAAGTRTNGQSNVNKNSKAANSTTHYDQNSSATSTATTSTTSTTPRHKYGSLGYFGSYGSGASLMALGSSASSDGKGTPAPPTLTSTLTGALESSMMEDMELMIAELTERLKDMETERNTLKNELNALKS